MHFANEADIRRSDMSDNDVVSRIGIPACPSVGRRIQEITVTYSESVSRRMVGQECPTYCNCILGLTGSPERRKIRAIRVICCESKFCNKHFFPASEKPSYLLPCPLAPLITSSLSVISVIFPSPPQSPAHNHFPPKW
jgi:hypothetical protein